MKIVVGIYVFISLIATEVSGRPGVSRGSTCETNRQCQSQHCMPACDDIDTSYCIDADWLFTRHGLAIPSCITDEDFKRKIQYTTEHSLGQTCHGDQNCISLHCIPQCQSTLWKCIEPKVFFERNSIQPPECITEDNIKVLNELKVPAASKKLGETCSGHLNCVSGNCVPICETLSDESRCIEPKLLFTMYDSPVPSCVNSDTVKSLLQLSVSTSDNNEDADASFADENMTNLRSNAQEQATTPSSTMLDKNMNEAISDEKGQYEDLDEITASNLEAKEQYENPDEIAASNLEAEALEKLRQIDVRVSELARSTMKKNTGFFSLFKWW